MRVKINKNPIRLYLRKHCYTYEEFMSLAGIPKNRQRNVILHEDRVDLKDVIKMSRFMEVNLYVLIG